MTLADTAEPRRRPLLKAYRLLLALLIFAAIVTEIATLVERGRFVPGNLFSFFTIQSNLFAVVVLLLSVATTRNNRTIIMLRGASTLYMALTGVVFSILLAGIEGAEFTAVPWDNTVLHYLAPIAVVSDWFLDVPSIRIPFTSALIWLIYPLAYAAYSLIRGPIVDWYPYPFLDPDLHAYPSIVLTMFVLTLFAGALAWAIAAFPGRRRG